MRVLFAFLFLFPILTYAHPIKMSVLYLSYTPDSQSAIMQFRVFGDDLIFAIEQETAKQISLEDMTDTDREILNAFIKKHVKISFGSQTFNLEFDEYEYNPKNLLLTLKYSFSPLSLKTGEEVVISNDLFFNQFPTTQTNWYELEIPTVIETITKCRSKSGCVKTYVVK